MDHQLQFRCLRCWKENFGHLGSCYACRGSLILVSPARITSLLASAGVVVGLADMPYGYYTLLRLVLCGCSLFLMFGAGLSLATWHRWILGSMAALYNPFVPIHLGDKGIWTALNIFTVVMFWAGTKAPR